MMSGPLAGRLIAVTRPQAQADELVQLIVAAGGQALRAPLLEVAPIEDRAPLQSVAHRLADYALAIFISPNAVNFSLPTLLEGGSWPAGLLPVALGQSTARALAAHGLNDCILPHERFDSEALLELPELQAEHVVGRRVLILRGNSGRELLAETLQGRGATVEGIACYRRTAPTEGFSRLSAAWEAGRLDALTLSSSEGLRYLLAGLDAAGRAFLAATPLFVPHRRIAETAQGFGLRHTILTAPSDEGIVAGLCAYNWLQHE